MNAQVIDFRSYRAKKRSLDEALNPFSTLMAFVVLGLVICEIWQRGLKAI